LPTRRMILSVVFHLFRHLSIHILYLLVSRHPLQLGRTECHTWPVVEAHGGTGFTGHVQLVRTLGFVL
jgi:hypothetical protein